MNIPVHVDTPNLHEDVIPLELLDKLPHTQILYDTSKTTDMTATSPTLVEILPKSSVITERAATQTRSPISNNKRTTTVNRNDLMSTGLRSRPNSRFTTENTTSGRGRKPVPVTSRQPYHPPTINVPTLACNLNAPNNVANQSQSQETFGQGWSDSPPRKTLKPNETRNANTGTREARVSRSPVRQDRRFNTISQRSPSPRQRSRSYQNRSRGRDGAGNYYTRRSPSYQSNRFTQRAYRSSSVRRRSTSKSPVETSTAVQLMTEIVDLNKQVTNLMSRVIDLEKNQAAVKQLMFGSSTSSSSSHTPLPMVDLSGNQSNSSFERQITRHYDQIERLHNHEDDNRKRNRERDIDNSKSRSRERNYRAYKSTLVFGDSILSSTLVCGYWKVIASVMLLLLIFICEDAITVLWQKLAVRAIISILVLNVCRNNKEFLLPTTLMKRSLGGNYNSSTNYRIQ